MTERKIRIVFLIPHAIKGGAEKQAIQQYLALQEIGYEVFFITLANSKENQNIFNHILIPCVSFKNPLYIFYLFKVVIKIKPDYLYSWFRQMDLFAFLYKLFFPVKWFIAERSSSKCYANIFDFFRRIVGLFADKIITNSNLGAEYWSNPKFLKHRNIYLLNNDYSQFISDLNIFNLFNNIQSKKYDCIYFGRITKEKNIDTLIKAFSFKNFKNFRLVIIGDGPEKSKLISLNKSINKNKNVKFLPYMVQRKLLRYIFNSEFFISLSFYEGNSNSLDEAILCNRNLILSNIKSHKLSAKNIGFFININKAIEEISNQILECFLNNEKLSKVYAKNYKIRQKDFYLNNYLPQLKKIFS